ncbi:hypothetical protein NE865_15333 [Phthorimaea operculella]|nr:hypothetical protein NE865_15333 [Phthorimaea operculella]
MDGIMDMLKKIENELSNQKQEMKEMEQNIKQSINSNINEKFKYFEEKTTHLEKRIDQQQKSIDFLESKLRRRNVIFFGVQEKEKGYENLLTLVLNIINNKMGIPCSKWEIENVSRIGKYIENKLRPIVVTMTTTGRKLEILKKKKTLEETGIYLKEDFPPNILLKRKELQEELKKERESGKRVALHYDKIVTLKTRGSKRGTPERKNTNKRHMSLSPDETASSEGNNVETTKQIPKKNKSQNSTTFLRQSQLNFDNLTKQSQNAQKN